LDSKLKTCISHNIRFRIILTLSTIPATTWSPSHGATTWPRLSSRTGGYSKADPDERVRPLPPQDQDQVSPTKIELTIARELWTAVDVSCHPVGAVWPGHDPWTTGSANGSWSQTVAARRFRSQWAIIFFHPTLPGAASSGSTGSCYTQEIAAAKPSQLVKLRRCGSRRTPRKLWTTVDVGGHPVSWTAGLQPVDHWKRRRKLAPTAKSAGGGQNVQDFCRMARNLINRQSDFFCFSPPLCGVASPGFISLCQAPQQE
jgi:hypothetical protein